MELKNIETEKYVKAFKESKFMNALFKMAKKAGEKVVYVALLLFFMYIDEETPSKAKVAIAGALGYLLVPMDLIPDFIPVVGFADDFSVVFAAIGYVSVCLKQEHKELALEKMEKWFEDFDRSEVEGLNELIFSKKEEAKEEK
ncbi:YkvA family protein [Flammeovirga sp. SJP92]|uniref:YkvA family protein n=1 Tax=Flammeovirga sp. SJP92 TaxID=1775430 RepID=UPI000788DB44|nr:YkvA family protein [Flammeovirga sp. SJP92]KXX72151.1 hypothetical protein AVL50_00700 [Flammeovirga sp. SJP92]